jgi:GR25 family glycosyltransferase involved in LPS biosynthesis
MKHFWINIDRCTDRKEFMQKQFKELGIEHMRVAAATPETIKDYSFIRHEGSINTDLEFACLVSHLLALETALSTIEDEYFCVMEDDVNVCKLDFDKIFSHLKQAEKRDNVQIDILQLYTNSHPFIMQMIREQVQKNEFVTKRIDGYPSTAYYLISRTGAKKLLDKFKLSDTSYDFSYSAWTAADNMLYSPVITYMLTYPVVTTNIKCGSIIHPSHLSNHEIANHMIRQIHDQMNLLDMFI